MEELTGRKPFPLVSKLQWEKNLENAKCLDTRQLQFGSGSDDSRTFQGELFYCNDKKDSSCEDGATI